MTKPSPIGRDSVTLSKYRGAMAAVVFEGGVRTVDCSGAGGLCNGAMDWT
jgi:hypothetical protein